MEETLNRAPPSPLVTFALFCFNQEKFVRHAVRSAFWQDCASIEIIVSDDASSDGTFAIIQEEVSSYNGPHRVVVNRNECNLGIGAHVNKVFSMASGEFIVMAAGDDISRPQRVRRLVDAWSALQYRPSSIFSAARCIDVDGRIGGQYSFRLQDAPRDAAALISYDSSRRILALGASAAYSKAVMRDFPPLLDGVNVEDIPLAIRAAMLGVTFLDEELVDYRVNTSVWLPRRVMNESFDRHRARMAYRVDASHSVARQIAHDCTLFGVSSLMRHAESRLRVATLLWRIKEGEEQGFWASLRIFYRSGHLKSTWMQFLLLSFPRTHRNIFRTLKFWRSLSRKGAERC